MGYLFRFAIALENPGRAVTLLMAAMPFAQDKEELRGALRRLRPQVSSSLVELISLFPDIFTSVGNFRLTPAKVSRTNLPSVLKALKKTRTFSECYRAITIIIKNAWKKGSAQSAINVHYAQRS